MKNGQKIWLHATSGFGTSCFYKYDFTGKEPCSSNYVFIVYGHFLTPTAELVAGTRHIICPRRSKTFPVRPPAEGLRTPGLTSSSEGDSSDRAPASAPVLCQVTTETGWRLRLQSQKIATRQVKREALAFKLAERAMIEKYSTAAGLKGPFSGDDSWRSNNLYMRSP